MIHTYCERQGVGLFAEPFNTLTNLAYIWAAVAAWKLAGRCKVRAWDLNLLTALAAAIGVGSGLWHMFASPWAKLLDLVPIFLFQLCFLWMYLRSCAGRSAVTRNRRGLRVLRGQPADDVVAAVLERVHSVRAHVVGAAVRGGVSLHHATT